MTYAELCERILFEAQRGGEVAEQANLNSRSVIEAMMPSVLSELTYRYASDENSWSILRQTSTIAMTNGVGDLPDSVLTECLKGAMVLEPDDADVLPEDISLVPQYVDFVAAKGYEPRLGYWCVLGNRIIHYVSAAGDYGEFTGDLNYIGATTPDIPADPDDPTGWDAELETDAIQLASEWLRGAKIAA